MAFIAWRKWPGLFFMFLMGLIALGGAFGGIDAAFNAAPLRPSVYYYTSFCRIDVSDCFEHVNGTVWTYIGKPEAEERFRIGLTNGTAVIAADYKADVESAFAAADRPFDAELHPAIAVVPLTRIDT